MLWRARFGLIRVVAAVATCAVTCTCDAPAMRPGVAAQPPSAPAPAPAGFDPESVALPEDAAERRLVAETDVAARLLAAEAAIESAQDEASRGRLHYLAGRAAQEAGQLEQARAHFGALAGSDHPLSPWAKLELATLLADEESGEPAAVIETLTDLPERWAGEKRARVLGALALARSGRTADAVPQLRQLVAEASPNVGAATAGMPLAEILAQSEDATEREEALALYRRVATHAPGARVGVLAEERAREVLATLPDERRAALAELSAADRFIRAEAFFNAMRNTESQEAFAELARDVAQSDPTLACEARLMAGKSVLRARRRDEGSRALAALADECTDEDVRAKARYLAARAHGRRGRHVEALALYDALATETPTHRLADDAVFRSAFNAAALGNEEDKRARWARAANDFPQGDMGPEARFQLAWDARERADAHEGADAERAALYEEALSHLEQALVDGPGEAAVDIRGRAAYWRARTLADLGRASEAAAGWDELARRYPFSYYAQQSLTQLGKVAPERVEQIREELTTAPPAALTFAPRPELRSAAFARAVELLRVAETDAAMAELEIAGLLGDELDDDTLWLGAAILDGAGAHPEASLLARRRLRSFLDDAPTGEARHRWRIAYPRAFSPLIESAAAAEGVPATFVRAIAREESAFNPRAVSVARAYGLIQLIRPTARRFGDELGLPSTPRALKTPEINVRIGSRFIGFLFRRYAENPAIVPSAYNAGEGASDRWLRQRGELPLDAWIETIPYDETRRYTRRVLQTWGTYGWLDEGRLPELREELPAPP